MLLHNATTELLPKQRRAMHGQPYVSTLAHYLVAIFTDKKRWRNLNFYQFTDFYSLNAGESLRQKTKTRIAREANTE